MNKLFASVLIAAAVSVSAAASQAMPFESNQTQDSLVVPPAGGAPQKNVRSLTSEDCKLGFDISRQFTAVGSELCHDLLVQPDIHLG